MTQLDLFEGRKRRDEGCEQVLDNSLTWKDDAIEAIIRLSNTMQEFTSDDIRNVIRPPHHGNAYGAAFASASKKKLIKRIGYRQSTIPMNHAHVVAIWTKFQ